MTERKNMSAVEYLMQIPKADALVRKLETRVNNLRMLATDNARYLNGPIGHGQPDYDKTGTLMAEICDAEEELAEYGVNIVIYANQLTRSAFPAMQQTAKDILGIK